MLMKVTTHMYEWKTKNILIKFEAMSKAYGIWDRVEWNWWDSTTSGKITKIYKGDKEKTIEGTQVKREASDVCPAYLIEQWDGSEVLKSHSEIKRQ